MRGVPGCEGWKGGLEKGPSNTEVLVWALPLGHKFLVLVDPKRNLWRVSGFL